MHLTIHVKRKGSETKSFSEAQLELHKKSLRNLNEGDSLGISFSVDRLITSQHQIFDGIASAKELCTKILKRQKVMWTGFTPVSYGDKPIEVIVDFNLKKRRDHKSPR